jgi:type VI secretion system secreted protein VgrG
VAWWTVGSILAFASMTGAQTVWLEAAENTTLLGGSTITNTGATTVSGNISLSPGVSVTGFPPGTITGGSIHINDELAVRSHANAFTAYTNLTHETFTTDLSGSVLGGAAPLTLTPGVYRFASTAQLTGSLILDTQGDPNAVFHFIIGTTLTTTTNSQVTFLNGSSTNVFWAIGTSATLGVGSTLQGNLIATTSVTVNSGVQVNGRVLAIDGAVTMDTNVIHGAAPASATASHWTGNASNTWSGGNWSPDANGEIMGRSLAPVADVIFSATGATSQNTVLDFNAAISSLTVNDPAAVTISGSSVLTIMGSAPSSGITIETGAGLTIINTDVVLKGSSETMAVNNAAGLRINSSISGTIGLTKTGPGTLTLAATNTYTGVTIVNGGTLKADAAGALGATSSIVVNSGGTILLSQSGSATTDRINDSSTITLNGGTLNTGGLSEHNLSGSAVTPGIGSLTLLSSSTIDMGNGASVLSFANSSAQAWTGSLTVLNWSGTPFASGGTDQLFFGTDSSGLTDTQLAQIAFYSDSGDTFLGSAGYAGENGEISPIPEPATWLAGTLVFGAVAFSQRRQMRSFWRVRAG